MRAQNLREAFAGESLARARYLFFAQRADVEGYSEVAAAFRQVAASEEAQVRVGCAPSACLAPCAPRAHAPRRCRPWAIWSGCRSLAIPCPTSRWARPRRT